MEQIAIHESIGSEKVVKFIDLNKFTKDFQNAYFNNTIHGCFYDDKNNIVAQDIWNNIHENILN